MTAGREPAGVLRTPDCPPACRERDAARGPGLISPSSAHSGDAAQRSRSRGPSVTLCLPHDNRKDLAAPQRRMADALENANPWSQFVCGSEELASTGSWRSPCGRWLQAEGMARGTCVLDASYLVSSLLRPHVAVGPWGESADLSVSVPLL